MRSAVPQILFLLVVLGTEIKAIPYCVAEQQGVHPDDCISRISEEHFHANVTVVDESHSRLGIRAIGNTKHASEPSPHATSHDTPVLANSLPSASGSVFPQNPTITAPSSTAIPSCSISGWLPSMTNILECGGGGVSDDDDDDEGTDSQNNHASHTGTSKPKPSHNKAKKSSKGLVGAIAAIFTACVTFIAGLWATCKRKIKKLKHKNNAESESVAAIKPAEDVDDHTLPSLGYQSGGAEMSHVDIEHQPLLTQNQAQTQIGSQPSFSMSMPTPSPF